jgi:hypothetical protein
VKAVTADSCRKGKPQKIFINRGMKQKVICLIYHQQGANCNKQVAVNEKSKEPGIKVFSKSGSELFGYNLCC